MPYQYIIIVLKTKKNINALPVYYHCSANKQKSHQFLITLSTMYKQNRKNLHQRIITLSWFCQKNNNNAHYCQQRTNEIEKYFINALLSSF